MSQAVISSNISVKIDKASVVVPSGTPIDNLYINLYQTTSGEWLDVYYITFTGSLIQVEFDIYDNNLATIIYNSGFSTSYTFNKIATDFTVAGTTQKLIVPPNCTLRVRGNLSATRSYALAMSAHKHINSP